MCEKHKQQDNAATSLARASVSVRVDDMTCGHCAGTIKDAIESTIPGSKVSANPESRLVSVQGAELAKVVFLQRRRRCLKAIGECDLTRP